MKIRHIISTFFLFAWAVFAYAGNKAGDPELIKKARHWMEQKTTIGFQENKGQMCDAKGKPVPYLLFKAEAPNLNIFITTSGLTYQFYKVEEEEEEETSGLLPKQEKISAEWHRIDMTLKGASIKKENVITGEDITQGNVNYYLAHCPDGVLNVRTYSEVTIKEVYPGIDWMLYTSKDGGIKHDFIVHPHANPGQVKLIYEGSGKLGISDNQIHLENVLGEITEGKLLCYQGNLSTPISSKYISTKNNSLTHLGSGFLSDEKNRDVVLRNTERKKIEELFSYEITVAVGAYNKSESLVIDPQLFWATLYGGVGDVGAMSADCDSGGNLYVTGYCGPYLTMFPWGSAYYSGTNTGSTDGFITRFTNAGILTWATYYGGSSFDTPYFIKCDPQNNIYITGFTESADFPMQIWAGAFNYPAAPRGFLLRFDSTGIRTWATEIGGGAMSIAFDNSGNGYVAGISVATFTPVVWPGAYNQAAVAGVPFIMRFTTATGALTWATCYGTVTAYACSVACDASGNIYISGVTTSAAFPTQVRAGAYNQTVYGGTTGFGGDIFILRFSNTGVLTWASYFGGSGGENYGFAACDASGNVYITGFTNSPDFPTQAWPGAYNQAIYGGSPGLGGDAFIARFNAAGALIWSTYYGGSGGENMDTYDNILIDNCGNVYISFNTLSANTFTFGNTGCGRYFDATYNGGTSWGDQFIVEFIY